MREQEFRRRFRRAIGEAPPLPNDFGARLATSVPASSAPRAAMWTVATLLLFAMVGVLVFSRWGLPSTSRPGSSMATAPRIAATPEDGYCQLPLVVTNWGPVRNPSPAANGANATSAQINAGTVTISSGAFVADPSARQNGMPFSAMATSDVWHPATYNPVVKRWLSEGLQSISPDHQRYAYIVSNPLTSPTTPLKSSELHVYDLRTGTDRLLWSHYGLMQNLVWNAGGLHVSTGPSSSAVPDPYGTPTPTGPAWWPSPTPTPWASPNPTPPSPAPTSTPGLVHEEVWLVNPASGAVSADPSPAWVVRRDGWVSSTATSPGPTSTLFRLYGVKSGSIIGTDSQGRPVIMEWAFQRGSAYTIFVGGAGGKRIVVHSGHLGDATGFDPTLLVGDGDALWGANRDATAIWRWTEAGGLKKYPLRGVARHDIFVTVQVAGPCLKSQ